MNTYEIEREDNVTVFFDAETIQQLEKSVMDYRIAFPTYSIKVYELDEQLKRKPNPMEYDSLSNNPDAEMEISRIANNLFYSFPQELQDLLRESHEHDCGNCPAFDDCDLVFKHEWIEENKESKN